MNVDDIKWLIWSHEHQAWWRANAQGYTTYRKDAGRYSWAEALAILNDANYKLPKAPNEALVPDLPNPHEQ